MTFNIDDLSQYTTIDLLSAAVKDCRACSLREQTYQVVHSDGDPHSPLMVVGMNPGFVESVTGIPLAGVDELKRSRCYSCKHLTQCHNWQLELGAFRPTDYTCRGYENWETFAGDYPLAEKVSVGAYSVAGMRTAGQIFNNCLKSLGVDRSKIFITNTCLCKTNSGDPRPEHILSCSRIKVATGRLVKPKVILTLGSLATNGYLPTTKGSFAALRGKAHEYSDSEYYNAKIVPTYHPSYIFRTMLNDSTGANKSLVAKIKWEFYDHIATALSILSPSQLKQIVSPDHLNRDGTLKIAVH